MATRELDLPNRHRYAIAAFSYIPAATIIPKFAEDFTNRVSTWVEEQKKNGDLAPGLAEQLDVQVKNLKDKNVPDLEILTFSGHLSFISKCFHQFLGAVTLSYSPVTQHLPNMAKTM